MKIFASLLIFFLGLGSWSSEIEQRSLRIVKPEFDWEAWEKLSPEERERNVLWKNKTHPDHCDPITEYKKALEFFRIQKQEINPSEGTARTLAGQISKGCKGATDRFITSFLLLKKSGVEHSKSIEYGLKFANTDNETLTNFTEIFQKAYLGEYFDMDYSTSLNLSFELSLLYKGNRTQARQDFLEISKFCLGENGLNLPASQCADIAVRLTQLSSYFPDGVRNDFFKLYKTLREDRRFGVSILTALRISFEVLRYGPTAPSTFLSSYEYAIDPQGLASGGFEAVKFAVIMAKNSVKTFPPPIYTPPLFLEANPNIHDGFVQGSTYTSDKENNASKKKDASAQ